MKKYALLLCGLAWATLSSTPVFADTVFDFSFTGNNSVSGSPGTPFSGSGDFTVKATGTAGEFKITGVTGTTDGQNISGIIAPGGFGFNDNFLFYTAGASAASLDNAGVSYRLANGVDANLFFGVPGQYQQSLFGFPGSLVSEDQTAPVSITPEASPVPEPGTMGLFATGALGMLGVVRRRIAV
ncbi:MAG: PEP-CTERM sorting domain-containing protein [Acidobacteriota bacterium]|nr:PEP-CTERM sorting domain-containing protein [Acidobacteriota bacterium]